MGIWVELTALVRAAWRIAGSKHPEFGGVAGPQKRKSKAGADCDQRRANAGMSLWQISNPLDVGGCDQLSPFPEVGQQPIMQLAGCRWSWQCTDCAQLLDDAGLG